MALTQTSQVYHKRPEPIQKALTVTSVHCCQHNAGNSVAPPCKYSAGDSAAPPCLQAMRLGAKKILLARCVAGPHAERVNVCPGAVHAQPVGTKREDLHQRGHAGWGAARLQSSAAPS